MFSQNQVQHLMIGKSSVSLTAVATVGNLPGNMTAGEIGAFTRGGDKYVESGASGAEANAVVGSEFVLYKKMADGSLLKSDVIKKADVEKVVLKVGTAATEKLEYYGYNGTSGSFEALDETFYRVRIEMKEGYTANDHGTTYFRHAIYESDASANQAEIAIGLAKNGNAGMSREIKNSSFNPPIRFKALCNEAVSATNDSSGIVTVAKGSTSVNIVESSGGAGDAGNYNGTTSDIAVGDYLRIADTDTTCALTNDVYKVLAISGTVGGAGPVVLTLDRPYTGTSGTRTDANNSTQVIPAATAIANDWGIALVGQSQDFTVGKKSYKKIDWTSGLEGSTTTTYTSSTSASPGIAVYEQIAELEWFCQGNEGNYTRMGYPMIDNPRAEVEDVQYDAVDIIYNQNSNGLVGVNSNRKVLTLAIPQSTPDFFSNGTDGLSDVLEVLLTGVPIYGGLVTANGGALAAGDLGI